MRKTYVTGASLALVLLVGSAFAADLTSGPQVGDSVGVFEPESVTGKFAGKKQCLV